MHPAGKKKSPIGVTRAGIVHELFFTTLPQHAFTACDVVKLYLHRGAFAPASGYRPPPTATSFKTGRFTGADFPLQPDGTLRCPAGQSLSAHEWHREADGSLRVVYAASIRSCRPCSLRAQCQWNGNATAKPRQVSVLLHPLVIGQESLLWQDWSRRGHRRAYMHLLCHQRMEVQVEPGHATPSAIQPAPLSRAERAHTRLSWNDRLARNAQGPAAPVITLTVFGLPTALAAFLGLPTL